MRPRPLWMRSVYQEKAEKSFIIMLTDKTYLPAFHERSGREIVLHLFTLYGLVLYNCGNLLFRR